MAAHPTFRGARPSASPTSPLGLDPSAITSVLRLCPKGATPNRRPKRGLVTGSNVWRTFDTYPRERARRANSLALPPNTVMATAADWNSPMSPRPSALHLTRRTLPTVIGNGARSMQFANKRPDVLGTQRGHQRRRDHRDVLCLEASSDALDTAFNAVPPTSRRW